jgi:cytochrome c biogenesis protein CcdA/thiol-disulfide isomerase/thioredoxin
VTLLLLAFVGGLLTIVSPCILPIVPLVFSQTTRTAQARWLMLAGLAVTFAIVAASITVGAAWVARANELGRIAALLVFGVVGLSLLSTRVAARLAQPIVATGARIDAAATTQGHTVGPLLTGAALGLLWAPCAGPILGLVIVGGITRGLQWQTVISLVAFAAGASTALALLLATGGQLTRRLNRSLIVEQWIRRGLGAAVLVGVAAITLGWDRALLAKGQFIQTAAAEELLVKRLAPAELKSLDVGVSLDAFAASASVALAREGQMPELPVGREWINSPPLTTASLKGKVVLVDFWTFDCINCLHALPYVKALYAKYKDQGLVVIGVHTPELPRERIPANVRDAVKRLGITYPVVIDGDYAIWRSFENEYWPAAYYVDASGQIRFHHFGEGRYDEQDAVVRKLLDEAKHP